MIPSERGDRIGGIYSKYSAVELKETVQKIMNNDLYINNNNTNEIKKIIEQDIITPMQRNRLLAHIIANRELL